MNYALDQTPKIHQEYSPQNTLFTPPPDSSTISTIPELIKPSRFKNN